MGYSNDNFWKLDKWDKIGIASLIVFFTIFVVLNSFCFASYEFTGDLVGAGFFNSNGDITFGDGWRIYRYKAIDCDYILLKVAYSSSFNTTNVNVIFGDDLVDSKIINATGYHQLSGVSGEYTYKFPYIERDYIYVCCYTPQSVDITLYTDDFSSGFGYASAYLGTSLSISAIWSVFNKSIPYILVVVLVSFGIYLITHAIREISKGRDV